MIQGYSNHRMSVNGPSSPVNGFHNYPPGTPIHQEMSHPLSPVAPNSLGTSFLAQPIPPSNGNQVRSYFKSTPFGGSTTASTSINMVTPGMHPVPPTLPAYAPAPPQTMAAGEPPLAGESMASIYDLMATNSEGASLQTLPSAPVPATPAVTSFGFSPLRQRPISPQRAASPLQATPTTRTPGYHHEFDPAFRNTVTVFGFPPEAADFVLNLFSNFGPVLEWQHVGNGNWMNIQYGNEIAAQMALGKNGMLVSRALMIGVVPMKQSHAHCPADDPSSSLSQLLSPLRPSPMAKMNQNQNQMRGSGKNEQRTYSPVIVQKQTASQVQPSFVEEEKEEKKQPASLVGNLLESVFGWN